MLGNVALASATRGFLPSAIVAQATAKTPKHSATTAVTTAEAYIQFRMIEA